MKYKYLWLVYYYEPHAPGLVRFPDVSLFETEEQAKTKIQFLTREDPDCWVFYKKLGVGFFKQVNGPFTYIYAVKKSEKKQKRRS